MISKNTQELFINLLLQINDETQKINNFRYQLAQNPYCIPQTLFKRLDRLEQNYISIANIQEFMTNNGLFYIQDQIKQYMYLYDQNNDLFWSYQDFKEAIMPSENPQLTQIVENRKVIDIQKYQMLPSDVELALSRLFEVEILALQRLNQQKKILLENFELKDNPEILFYVIDTLNCGCINVENLKKYLQNKGIIYNINERDIINYINLYQKKLVKTQQIQKQDFLQFLYFFEKNNEKKQKTLFEKNAFLLEKKNKENLLTYTFQLQNHSEQTKAIFFNQRTLISIQNHQKRNLKQTKNLNKKSNIIIEESQRKFSQIILQIINLEKEHEYIKKKLLNFPQFNTLKAFRLFDIDGKGKISVNEIKIFFEKIELYPQKHDLYLFIRRFDKDNDGFLTFGEFNDIFFGLNTPLVEDIRYDLQFLQQDIFCQQSRQIFIQFLCTIIENECAIEGLKQIFFKKNKLKDIFYLIDFEKKGFLNQFDIQNFIEKEGIQIPENDFQYFFRRFFQSNYTQRVSLAQFLREFTPKSPKQY
ncbi:hypothetical protein IMG5_114630 [Ichthyophthirius multifiliis]|uniref:EF-hand domain-containing protein n=1 Tax=Ichthyophthirius multifiliis TaxID=5932 RepID=G0QU31_ICHMU|nr:hypothetical protein IMG5_114630 [Ichthyophthirius multifiliis]EGR31255.1 hypothetical protein IMG5_114630 [Ichthyophthirius multifiliis]|eukprot:XP_004034741.1 hypothetical protein IMG5_114630 [Ichthyophthirius multifiliis]